MAVGLLLALVAGTVMLTPSSAQIPPPPTLPPFTFPTFPTFPPPPTLPPFTTPSTQPPPTMAPPTSSPPPTMAPPTSSPPPTQPPVTARPNIDQLIDNLISRLEGFGDRFQDVIDQLRALQSRF